MTSEAAEDAAAALAAAFATPAPGHSCRAQSARLQKELDEVPLEAELLAAVEADDVRELKTLITSGADVNKPLDDSPQWAANTTLLIRACQLRRVQVALLLIKEKADILRANAKGDTALLAACEQGLEDVVAELLDAGANESAHIDKQSMPSFDSGDATVVDRLEKLDDAIANGDADRDGDDESDDDDDDGDEGSGAGKDGKKSSRVRSLPLIVACRNGHMHICEMLLAHRARANYVEQPDDKSTITDDPTAAPAASGSGGGGGGGAGGGGGGGVLASAACSCCASAGGGTSADDSRQRMQRKASAVHLIAAGPIASAAAGLLDPSATGGDDERMELMPPEEKMCVCYICETHIPATQFQRHCDLCFVQHKMGQEIVQCQSRLQEVMYTIHALVKQTKATMGRVMVDIFKPVMNGYMEKEQTKVAGIGRTTRRFWFELCRASLYYFKNESKSRDGHHMKGCLPLTHLESVMPVHDKGNGTVFELQIAGKKGASSFLQLQVATALELETWIPALYQVCEMHPFIEVTLVADQQRGASGRTRDPSDPKRVDPRLAMEGFTLTSTLSTAPGRRSKKSAAEVDVDGKPRRASTPMPMRQLAITTPSLPDNASPERRLSRRGKGAGATKGGDADGAEGATAAEDSPVPARRSSRRASVNGPAGGRRGSIADAFGGVGRRMSMAGASDMTQAQKAEMRAAQQRKQMAELSAKTRGHAHYTTTMQDCMVCSLAWAPFQEEYEHEMRSLHHLFMAGAAAVRLAAGDADVNNALREVQQQVTQFLNGWHDEMGLLEKHNSMLQLLFDYWAPLEAKKRTSSCYKCAHTLLEAIRQKRMLFTDWHALNERFNLDPNNKNAQLFGGLEQDGLQAKASSHSSIQDFQLVKPISRGAFGRVFLCRHRVTQMLYAVKILDKAEMEVRNQISNIVSERRIMAEAENEFVVQLYYAFQSKSYMFLVMDYQPGGDLDTMLENVGCILEPWAKHYVAEMVMAVDYLHQRKIIHRDLKPSNWLISKDGHLKLADFGLSHAGLARRDTMPLSRFNAEMLMNEDEDDEQGQFGADGKDEQLDWSAEGFQRLKSKVGITNAKKSFRRHASRQFSTVGTPGYASPEVLQNRGHDKTTDWWSVGVTMYELLAGIPPFLGDSVEEILNEMLQNQIDFSSLPEETSDEAKKTIQDFLTIDPTKRLGAETGAEEIQKHEWFQDPNLHWRTLRQNQGPFVPKLNTAEDTDYFKNGRQDQLAACMSLLGAIKGEGDEGGGDPSKRNSISNLQQVGGLMMQDVMGFDEEDVESANLFIDKYLREEGESDDEEEGASFNHKLSGDNPARKFSTSQIGVVKNFSYKNLVRLHSRNKAQMQRQSFFVRAGGRNRFGAAGPDLMAAHHRLANANSRPRLV